MLEALRMKLREHAQLVAKQRPRRKGFAVSLGAEGY